MVSNAPRVVLVIGSGNLKCEEDRVELADDLADCSSDYQRGLRGILLLEGKHSISLISIDLFMGIRTLQNIRGRLGPPTLMQAPN